MPKQAKSTSNKLHAQITKFALSLPGAYEEFPWGERVRARVIQ
jgi:hypothetical protein